MGDFISMYNGQPIHGENLLRVMIVDKQEVFRRKIRDILHGIGGFQVVAEAATSQKLLSAVEETRINLVIIEFRDGNDAELIASLKQQAAAPHVVIFSTEMHVSSLLPAVLAGTEGCLLKDMPLRDMIRAFKNFERGGPAMSPTVTASIMSMLVERCNTLESQRTACIDTPKRDYALVYSLQTQQSKEHEIEALHTSFSPSRLSPQEERVFTLLRSGQSNKQIAARLAISPYTVSKHVQNILRKLGVVNRTQAAAYTSYEGGAGQLVPG